MALETATASAVALNGGKQSRQFQGLFNIIPFTFTFDENSIASGLTSVGDITVTGARLGDFVMIAPTIDLVGIGLHAWVQSSDTVSIAAADLTIGTNTTLQNNTTFNGIILQPKQNVLAWTSA